MSMNESQRINLQKAFLAFHNKHVVLTNFMSNREQPMTQILCRVCDWTEEIRTNSGMNIGLRLASRRHFMHVQSKRRMRNKLCPVCKESKGIREIIWGMPTFEPDENKYYLGGCVSEDFRAKYKCVDCAWEGNT